MVGFEWREAFELKRAFERAKYRITESTFDPYELFEQMPEPAPTAALVQLTESAPGFELFAASQLAAEFGMTVAVMSRNMDPLMRVALINSAVYGFVEADSSTEQIVALVEEAREFAVCRLPKECDISYVRNCSVNDSDVQ